MEKKLQKRNCILVLGMLLLLCVQQLKAQSYHYAGTNNPTADTATVFSQAVTYDNNGNAYFAETIHNTTSIDYYAIRITKINSAGIYVTHTVYQYSANGLGDSVVAMQVIGNYLYVLVNGQFDFSPFDKDAVLLKYNLSLVYQWSGIFNGPGNTDDVPVSLAAGPSGSILVSVFSAGNMITLMYNSGGAIIHTATYNTGAAFTDQPIAMRFSNQAIYVAGTSSTTSTGNKTVLIKYDVNLTQLWASAYHASNPTFNDIVNDATIDSSGNIYTVGSYYNATYRPIIIKYDAMTGTKTWIKRLTTLTDAAAFRVFTDNNANPIVYVTSAMDAYEHLDKTTGASLIYKPVFSNPNIHFHAVDVQKGGDNNIYAFGNYDTLFTYMSDPVAYHGIAIAKINLGGNKIWTYLHTTTMFALSDLTIHAGSFAVKGNSKVIYSENISDLILNPYPLYCSENSISAATGLRIDDEPENVSTNQITAYPNPANDFVNVSIPADPSETATFELVDLSGKIIVNKEVSIQKENASTFTLDCKSYTEGLYLMRISANDQLYTSKILIKH